MEALALSLLPWSLYSQSESSKLSGHCISNYFIIFYDISQAMNYYYLQRGADRESCEHTHTFSLCGLLAVMTLLGIVA